MGAKGDRGAKEPLARRLYADGLGLPEISRQLDISETTLRKWKNDTAPPSGDGPDEWDRMRQQKRSNIQRLKDLFDRELEHVECQDKGSLTAASMDALSKLGSLVQRWEAVERATAEANRGPAYDKPKVFLDNLEWIARYLSANDPEGLKVLARNFDLLVMSYKSEHA